MKTITLHSTHGDSIFDVEGNLVSSTLDTEEYPLRHQPRRLDVDDWQARYPGQSPFGEWDILDWSFWSHSGLYSPFVELEE